MMSVMMMQQSPGTAAAYNSGNKLAAVTSNDPAAADADRTSSSSSKRQLLRPWLEAQVNSGRFPGVCWVNELEGTFKIGWKRLGRADWSPTDALLFKEWAIHTGRYREGVDKEDYPTWKTRLRCALTRMPDIKARKDLNCNDDANPYRVFQFLEAKRSGSPSESQQDSPPFVSEDSCSLSGSPPFYPPVLTTSSNVQPNIPNFIFSSPVTDVTTHGYGAASVAQVSNPGQDLQQVTGFLVPTDVQQVSGFAAGVQPASGVATDVQQVPGDLQNVSDLFQPGSDVSLTAMSVDSNINLNLGSCPDSMEIDSLKDPDYERLSQLVKPDPAEKVNPEQPLLLNHHLTLKLRRGDEVVKNTIITNPRGCRVYHGDLNACPLWNPELLGDKEADQILIPYNPEHQEESHDQLLSAMEMGLNLSVDNGNIYLVRRCKARVFVAPSDREEKRGLRVERNVEPLKIFDFVGDFLPAFLRYREGEGPRPLPYVIIALGRNFRTDIDPYADLLFSVTVGLELAYTLLAQREPGSPPVEISHSNEYDDILDRLKAMTVQNTAPLPVSTSADSVPHTVPYFTTSN